MSEPERVSSPSTGLRRQYEVAVKRLKGLERFSLAPRKVKVRDCGAHFRDGGCCGDCGMPL